MYANTSFTFTIGCAFVAVVLLHLNQPSKVKSSPPKVIESALAVVERYEPLALYALPLLVSAFDP